MYQAYWGLQEAPCRNAVDLRAFYAGSVHAEAFARLQFLVDEHRHVGLLLGGAGTGKTLVLERFAAELRRAGHPVARVDLIGIPPNELLWQLAAQWGASPLGRTDEFSLWRIVSDRLAEFRCQRLSVILLLDSADQAREETLLQVLRIVQCDPTAENRLTTVLAARQLTPSPATSRLCELTSLRIDLEPWDQEETIAYLKTSLARVGAQGKTPTFGEEALVRLYQLTQGIPRHVNQLADLALLAGAGRQLAQIDSEIIESVYHELGTLRASLPSA